MKKNAKKKSGYFTHGEIALWCLSVTLILVSFILFDREKYMTLIASLIGVTSLIFNAKGNPIGQALTVVFSVLYGIISFRFAYYGEMITYLSMTMPMAIVALVAWLRHPYRGRRAEVEINRLRGRGDRVHASADGGGDLCLLFYSACLPHGKSYSQHDIGHDKFSGGVSYFPQECVLRRCLCGERRGSDRTVDNGGDAGFHLHFGDHLLRHVSAQRRLRFRQLVGDEKAAGGGPGTSFGKSIVIPGGM